MKVVFGAVSAVSAQPPAVPSPAPSPAVDGVQRIAPSPEVARGEDGPDPRAAEAADTKSARELSPEEEEAVRTLKARDREVRSHEAAHQAAGGGLTGGATFTFETGPDGRQYAVGGEVSIDIGAHPDPEQNARKMRQVISAALAPLQPSAQDLAVAARARAALASTRAQGRGQPLMSPAFRARAVQAYQQAAPTTAQVASAFAL